MQLAYFRSNLNKGAVNKFPDFNCVQKKNMKKSTLYPHSEDELNCDQRLNEARTRVFENPLIVAHICYFLCSADVLGLRLINNIFQQEATKRFRYIHKHIVLRSNCQVEELLQCLRKRADLKLAPFPFSGFEVDIALSSMENFGQEIGTHIVRYLIRENSYTKTPGEIEKMGDTVAMLLAHSPQLVELKLLSLIQISVSDQGLQRFPTQFYRLSVIDANWSMDYGGHMPRLANPLLDILVARATNLIKLKLPWNKQGLESRINRSLALNPRINIYASANTIHIDPDSTGKIQELINLKLKFTEIFVNMEGLWKWRFYEPMRVNSMFKTVLHFLEVHSSILSNLQIVTRLNISAESSHPFPLPFTLRVLKNLWLKFPDYAFCSSRPIQPLIGNQFPVLRKLVLQNYRDVFGMFGNCLMPSVNELDLIMHYHYITLTDTNLHLAFPNVTSLYIYMAFGVSGYRSEGKNICPTLAYVFSHLTKLVNLNLEFLGLKDADCWNVLTGETPCPGLNHQLNVVDLGNSSESVQESYQGLSLQNMRALKTLRFSPCSAMTLSAILRMTRDARMVPLQKLTLGLPEISDEQQQHSNSSCYDLFKKTCLLESKEELAKFHKEVIFITDSDNMPKYPPSVQEHY